LKRVPVSLREEITLCNREKVCANFVRVHIDVEWKGFDANYTLRKISTECLL
jgi:hypothetical protein